MCKIACLNPASSELDTQHKPSLGLVFLQRASGLSSSSPKDRKSMWDASPREEAKMVYLVTHIEFLIFVGRRNWGKGKHLPFKC